MQNNFETESSSARDDFDRLWTSQLYKEHKEITWYHKVKLGPVVIKISDMKSNWGKWEPFYRTITMSRKLIQEYSWDVVLEILKHEMAHQYVTDCLGLAQEMSHGEPFKKACLKLGVASWAARATGEIPEQIPALRERVLSSEDERLLARAEKLLSLAQSSNEHESLLAMQKVRELYAKHNFEKIKQSANSDDMDSLFLSRKKKKTEPTEAKILSILNDHFRVKVIHTHLYCAKSCERYKAAEVLGRRENILMAEFVYYFLNQQIDSLWAQHRKNTKCQGNLRRSYQLGVLSGFDEKLSKGASVDEKVYVEHGCAHSEVKALQVKERNLMDDFVDVRYPRLSKKSWGGGRVDQGTFHTGQSAGRSLNLNRPITSSGGFGGYLT